MATLGLTSNEAILNCSRPFLVLKRPPLGTSKRDPVCVGLTFHVLEWSGQKGHTSALFQDKP